MRSCVENMTFERGVPPQNPELAHNLAVHCNNFPGCTRIMFDTEQVAVPPSFQSISMSEDKRAAGPVCDALLPPKKRQRLAKRVRFDEGSNTVQTRLVSNENDRESWLQSAEYEAIREQNVLTIIALKKAQGQVSLLNSKEVCVRGLEGAIFKFLFRTKGSSQRKITKAVVELHRAQCKLGSANPEELHSFATCLTANDKTRALKAASVDSFNR